LIPPRIYDYYDQISDSTRERITSDHGCGWGYGMERNFLGDFLPESLEWRNKERSAFWALINGVYKKI